MKTCRGCPKVLADCEPDICERCDEHGQHKRGTSATPPSPVSAPDDGPCNPTIADASHDATMSVLVLRALYVSGISYVISSLTGAPDADALAFVLGSGGGWRQEAHKAAVR